MTEEKLLKLEQSIENLKSKKSKIYLLVQDTKGNAKASLTYIYKFVVNEKHMVYSHNHQMLLIMINL